MKVTKFAFSLLPETLAICKLSHATRIPDWGLDGKFVSITRMADEISIVCPQDKIPQGITSDQGWRCLKVEGPFDFSATGVVASFTRPLSAAGIAILVISTYDTDYLMVREKDLEGAIQVLSDEGHGVRR